jgi:hypothetical protein
MKNGNMLYLFDFDGTLFGQEHWLGIWKNWKLNFQKGPYLNPAMYDIRWSVLTGRPKIDKFPVWLCCNIYGLFPERIFTIPTWTYPFEDDEAKWSWKVEVITKILKDAKAGTIERKITNIVYVDNDLPTIDYINKYRHGRSFVAVTVNDFIQQTYNFLL